MVFFRNFRKEFSTRSSVICKGLIYKGQKTVEIIRVDLTKQLRKISKAVRKMSRNQAEEAYNIALHAKNLKEQGDE